MLNEDTEFLKLIAVPMETNDVPLKKKSDVAVGYVDANIKLYQICAAIFLECKWSFYAKERWMIVIIIRESTDTLFDFGVSDTWALQTLHSSLQPVFTNNARAQTGSDYNFWDIADSGSFWKNRMLAVCFTEFLDSMHLRANDYEVLDPVAYSFPRTQLR